jgi:urease accessory protein
MARWLLGALYVALGMAIAALLTAALLSRNEEHPFLIGLAHPVFGLEHFLSMLAIGLWGGRVGRLGSWALPLSFVAGLAISFPAAVVEPVPAIEPSMRRFVLISTGIVTAVALRHPRLPLRETTAGLIAVGFGHGYLGGVDAPAGALLFGLGFFATALALLTLGVIVGLASLRPR